MEVLFLYIKCNINSIATFQWVTSSLNKASSYAIGSLLSCCTISALFGFSWGRWLLSLNLCDQSIWFDNLSKWSWWILHVYSILGDMWWML